MDVNSALCVGRESINCCRSRKCVCISAPKKHSPIRSSKSYRYGPRILPVTPKYSTRDQATYTKSILRSHSPNSRNGSPTGNRNVRFSDSGRTGTCCGTCGSGYQSKSGDLSASDHPPKKMKDYKTEISTQTIQPGGMKVITPSKTTPRIITPSPQRHKPLHYNTRTSTPRYSPNPGGKDEDNDGHMIIHNFPIERHVSIETQTGYEDAPDGNRIVHNLDMHHSTDTSFPCCECNVQSVSTCTQTSEHTTAEPYITIKSLDSSRSPKPPSPVQMGGHKAGYGGCQHDTCEQSMKLDLSTQTSISDESLRSQSPECQCSTYSDQGLDESTQTSEWVSFGTQTEDNRIADILEQSMDNDQPGEQQDANSPRQDQIGERSMCHKCCHLKETVNECNESSQPRSVSVQANSNEPLSDNTMDQEHTTKTTAVQCPMPEVTVPDGKSIIKNFGTKRTPSPHVAEKKVCDTKWKEFVATIDKPTDYSIDTPDSASKKKTSTTKSKPTKDTSQTNIELKPCEALSSYSARTLLENDMISKHQYDQIIQAELMKLSQSSGYSYIPKVQPSLSYSQHRPGSPESLLRKGGHRTAGSDRFLEKDVHNQDMQLCGKPLFRTRSNSLDFSPIRTYSFQPETVQRSITNRRVRAKPPVPRVGTLLKGEDNQPRNLFIRSLDLGPLKSERPSSLRRPYSSCSDSPNRSLTTGESRSDVSDRHKYTMRDSPSSYIRSSSSSPIRNRSSSPMLTQSLNQLRNTAVRKRYSEHTESRHHSGDRISGNRSNSPMGSHISRIDRFKHRPLQEGYHGSKRQPSSPSRGSLSPKPSPHYSLPISYHYLEALNDLQNKRRASRERSPLRTLENYSDRSRRHHSPASIRRQLNMEADY